MSLFSHPDRVVRGLVRSQFTITTHDGQTWQGVLIEVDETTLVLRQASVIDANGQNVAADGEVLLPRLDVAYMQRV